MSYADEVYKATCRKILEEGYSDEGMDVRPHWADGTPAHTVKIFGVVNRYDLSKEFPIMTLRRTYWKSAVDELCGSGRKNPTGLPIWAATSGTSGQGRTAPSARPTATSWAFSTTTKKGTLTRLTGCSMI